MNQPRFWAKTGQGEKRDDGQPKYHPVICHLADTAAVAMEIVRSYLSPVAIATLERGLGLKGESLVKCCGFLAGCHDLGKVSPAFQFQVDPVGQALAGGELYDLWHNIPELTRKEKTPHGTITAKTLPEFLVELGLKWTLANKLAILVGGHHGFFPSSDEIKNLNGALAGFGEDKVWWQRKYSHTTFNQLLNFVELTLEDLPTDCDNAAAMILAGLTTVSDWIASNSDEKTGFPYAHDQLFATYAKDLPERAKKALHTQGWMKLPPMQPQNFGELFPFPERPLQEIMVQFAKTSNAPCLAIVEASMGEGKTEAALYLADALQHQSGTGGFYIGLPTQATSNAMFKRVQAFLRKRYKEQVVNLTLSHSSATLSGEYQNTVCRLDQVYDEEGQGVFASEWHTARRKSLLSPYGVGTLDQALIGALRSRWQFVRLFGLAGRTVILDEIHAYDLYTGTLLERFLEWLAVLGSPVIALSATLPSDTRERLVQAYAKGCHSQEPSMSVADYPRLTTYTPEKGVNAISFSPSAHVTRDLHLQWKQDDKWIDELKDRLTEGGCAAVICSTVGRAQVVFQRLKDSKYFTEDELGLFHGRFLFADREEIEEQCIIHFGKPSDPKTYRPWRFVLVATQVVEQSLDLDFDLMMSDLAPVDLLLQRSGRLHRHEDRKERPEKLSQPMLWLIDPVLDKAGKAQFGDSEFIYDRHVLLRTWLTLRDCPCLKLPATMDELIESVYNLEISHPENLEQVHAQDWQDSLYKYQQDREAYKELAKRVYLPSTHKPHKPDEFTRGRGEDDDNTITAVTRLGEKSVTTIFIQRTAAGLVLPRGSQLAIDPNQTPDLSIIKALLSNSTRISKKGLVEVLIKQQEEKNIKSIRKKWTSSFLKHCCCVELDAEGKTQVDKWNLYLDPERGVVITSG